MKHWKQCVFWIAFLLEISVIGFGIRQLAIYCRNAHTSQSRYEELSGAVHSFPTEFATVPASGMLPEYEALFSSNPHLVGWIQIEDTPIDYPVVQTPEDPEYYLYRDFDGRDNDRGCIFAHGACDVDSSQNVTLYGHHMADGSMFTGLLQYTSRPFWLSHPTIVFDSLTEHRSYDIFAVFRTTASLGEGFDYHQFVDAATEEEFHAFVDQCKALSLYDTGITPEFGNQILCLSTCEYSRENGRFVVAAVLQP